MTKCIMLVLALAVAGCSTPAKAHYKADRAYLDRSGKRFLEYVDADPAMDAKTKAGYHLDWELLDAEVRHALAEDSK